MFGNFFARFTNSSKDICPSPSESHCFMSHSTLRVNCFSLAMFVALTILRSSSASMLPLPVQVEDLERELHLVLSRRGADV